MKQHKDTDRQLVENLIATRNFDPFIQKFKGDIFKAIEKSYRKFDKDAVLSQSQKEQLMNDFIELLLDDHAKRLQGYLHPKGYKTKKYSGKKNIYKLVSSGDFIGDDSVPDLKQAPLLDECLKDQYAPFFDSKVIVNGILSHNINVIQTFFFSDKCRNYFKNWFLQNNVFTMEALEEVEHIQSNKENKEDPLDFFVVREIQEYVNKLYVEIEKEKEERGDCCGELLPRREPQKSYEKAFLTPIQSYKFKEYFYYYFNDYVLRPYLSAKYFSGSDSDSTNITIDYLEKYDEVYDIKTPQNKQQNPDSTNITIDYSENDDDEYDKQTPKNGKQNLQTIQPGVFHEPTRKHDIENLLERIFRVMEQTKSGKRKAQALRKRLSLMKMGLTDFEVDRDVAEDMGITLGNYRKMKSDTIPETKKIINKYFKTEYETLLNNEKHG